MSVRNMIEWKCDYCERKVVTEAYKQPGGWITTKEDHSDSMCPKCQIPIKELADKLIPCLEKNDGLCMDNAIERKMLASELAAFLWNLDKK